MLVVSDVGRLRPHTASTVAADTLSYIVSVGSRAVCCGTDGRLNSLAVFCECSVFLCVTFSLRDRADISGALRLDRSDGCVEECRL